MKKRILALLTVLFLLGTLPLTAFAEETIITEPKGSITVKAIYEKTPLTGLELTCYRVGNLVINDEGHREFVRVQITKSLNEEIESNPGQLADDLWEWMQRNSHLKISHQTEAVNKEGYLTFYDCEPGLYLIRQEKDFSLNGKKYETLSHFLVTVPYDGKYDVDANVKLALDVYRPTEEPPATTKPGSSLPQTGQLNWPVPALAASGMLLFALGWMLRSDGRKDGYEE